jgi:hypothetical protein
VINVDEEDETTAQQQQLGDENNTDQENNKRKHLLQAPTRVLKAQLSLPQTSDNPNRAKRRSLFKRAAKLSHRSASEMAEREVEKGVTPTSPEDIDLADFEFNVQLKNVGEVAAMALLKHRIQHGSITSADVPLVFRRNAAILRDLKHITMCHQLMKQNSENRSVGADSRHRNSPGNRSDNYFTWSASQQSLKKYSFYLS